MSQAPRKPRGRSQIERTIAEDQTPKHRVVIRQTTEPAQPTPPRAIRRRTAAQQSTTITVIQEGESK